MALRVVAGYLLAGTPVGRFGAKMRGASRGSLGTSNEETGTAVWRAVWKGATRVMGEAAFRRAAARVMKVAPGRLVKTSRTPAVVPANLPGPGDWWIARHTRQRTGPFRL